MNLFTTFQELAYLFRKFYKFEDADDDEIDVSIERARNILEGSFNNDHGSLTNTEPVL